MGIVGVERAERVREPRRGRSVDRVADVRTIDRHDRDAAFVLDGDRHADSLRAIKWAFSLRDASERAPVRDATTRDSDV